MGLNQNLFLLFLVFSSTFLFSFFLHLVSLVFISISAFAAKKRVYQSREQMRWDVDIHIASEEGKEEPG